MSWISLWVRLAPAASSTAAVAAGVMSVNVSRWLPVELAATAASASPVYDVGPVRLKTRPAYSGRFGLDVIAATAWATSLSKSGAKQPAVPERGSRSLLVTTACEGKRGVKGRGVVSYLQLCGASRKAAAFSTLPAPRPMRHDRCDAGLGALGQHRTAEPPNRGKERG